MSKTESNERAVTRWYYDPKHPYRKQEWQIKVTQQVDGKTVETWVHHEGREHPQMTTRNLMKKWMFTQHEEDDVSQKCISVIARYFGVEIRDVKTLRTRINNQFREQRCVNFDLLGPLRGFDDEGKEIPFDWTHYEMERIEKASRPQTVSDIFDSLPDSLKEHMQHLLEPEYPPEYTPTPWGHDL